MTGKEIGYIRVSTTDQNPDRQLEGLKLDKRFIEYASGTTIKRPQLLLMMDYVRDDDIVVVHSMDRMARNVKDLLKIIDTLIAKRVTIRFVKENLTFTGDDSALSRLLLMMLGAVAEFEHSLIRERQAEGIALAKKRGAYKGKKRVMTPVRVAQLKDQLTNTRKSKTSIAQELGVCRWTLHKYLRENPNLLQEA